MPKTSTKPGMASADEQQKGKVEVWRAIPIELRTYLKIYFSRNLVSQSLMCL